jgi:hypothetical protein
MLGRNVRAVALHEFSYYNTEREFAVLRKGGAADVPAPVFESWRLKGLVEPAPQASPQSFPVSNLRMEDDGHECWLTHGDGTSPRVPRSGAVLALAGWVSVFFGMTPKDSELVVYSLWAVRALTGK